MPIEQRIGTLPDIIKHPFRVTCEQRLCNYSIAAKTHKEGAVLYQEHSCPYIGGPTHLGWSVTLTTLEKCWIKLDATVAELMEGSYPPITYIVSADDHGVNEVQTEHPEKTRLKGVCRGMAEVLAEFMGPHFRTADEIAGEAQRRYKAKKAGEEYETPGLGHLRFQPPPGTSKYEGDGKVTKLPMAGRNPAPSPVHKFTEDEVGSIKFAAESGMFTTEQLAKTYKVKVEVIEKVLAG